ncbi:MAG: NADPH-dependent FMN reductase [Xanthomonadales bacterium]|nr:NADPH-dependent FMN reductase [Xanthomonadales bacterium]
MTRILGISGSLRKGSYNTALLRAACERFPGLIEVASIRDIPLYDGDLEQVGFPDSVQQLKDRLLQANGLLIASPEYNNSVPGVLKNAIDWLSRPSQGVDNAFRGKPVAVLGASPGHFGTILSQDAWLSVFRGLSAQHWMGRRLLVAAAAERFDEHGGLSDENLAGQLETFVSGFVDFIDRCS